jgi:hypothetical protein
MLLGLTILAGGARAAGPDEPMTLSGLAARQRLHDELIYAKATGPLNRAQRYMLLAEAKEILKPQEYEGFKRALDRVSPPPPMPKKQSSSIARYKPRPKATPVQQGPSVARSAPAIQMPAEVTSPDRVVLTSGQE